jgi:acyl-CoA-binding protein
MNDNIESLLDSLSLESCYALAIKFYRSFESKAFTPSYEERNRLVALTLQSKYGSFDPERVHSETGALDVVGRDRRTAWSSLGDMSQDQAKREFIFMMDTLCSRFKAFLLAHVKQEEAKREEIEKVKRQQEQEQMVRKQEVERQEAQK